MASPSWARWQPAWRSSRLPVATRRMALPTWSSTVFGAAYVGLLGTLAFLTTQWTDPASFDRVFWPERRWVLVLLAAVWSFDTGAYLVGRAFGRRPFLPWISPSKTMEGVLGGLVVATVGVAAVLAMSGRSPLEGLVLGPLLGRGGPGGRPRREPAQTGGRREGLRDVDPGTRRNPGSPRLVPVRRACSGGVCRAPSPAEAGLGVALLGSGGSIGRQALEVLAGLAPEWRVVALATGSRASLLETQARQFRPRAVALGDDTPLDLPAGTLRLHGEDALVEMVTRDDVDLVVVATGGIVSLRPVLAALRAGKVVATANKETLVAGGHLVMAEARALAAAHAAADPSEPLGAPAGLAPADRLGALGHLAVPRRRRDGGSCRARAHGVGRPVPRHAGRGVRRHHARDGTPPPDMEHGGQDHDRFGDPRQQGPRGDRGALALRRGLRGHRGRHPSPVGGPLRRALRGRLAQGPAWHSGHAAPDPVRDHASVPPAVACRHSGPRGRRAAGFPVPRHARGSRPSGSPARPGCLGRAPAPR